jgi:hypothetical protein
MTLNSRFFALHLAAEQRVNYNASRNGRDAPAAPPLIGALYSGTAMPLPFIETASERCCARRRNREADMLPTLTEALQEKPTLTGPLQDEQTLTRPLQDARRLTGPLQDEQTLTRALQNARRLTGPLPDARMLTEDRARIALPEEVKEFIVRSLARYETPSQVAAAVKATFGIEVSRQHVHIYDPAGARPPAERWAELHAVTREKFLADLAQIGVAQKVVRLQMLDRFARHAEDNNYFIKAAAFLEQAAKECGGIYESRTSRASTRGTPPQDPSP